MAPHRLQCFAVLTCLLAGVLAFGCKKDGLQPPSGDIVPLLALPTMDGDTFDAETLRGKPTLVAFWRPNCGYCIEELPDLAILARDHDVQVVTVMVQGKPELARSLLTRSGVTAVAKAVLIDENRSLREKLAVDRVPYTLVLDSHGRATQAFLGKKSRAELAAALARAK